MDSRTGKKRAAGVVALVAAALAAGAAFARGGGGCLEEGTPVLTPSGPVAVERLAPGDEVLSVCGGRLITATVAARMQVQPEEYVVLRAAGRMLRVTAEHPLAVAPGTFREASYLRAGDALLLREGDSTRPALIEAVARVKAGRPAYNLLVTPGGTYLADGLIVHNKGCFLPDTPILRADGSETAIADVRPGEKLLAFTPAGEIVTAEVAAVLAIEVDEYALVTTDRVTLRVTLEHPFYAGDGTFKTLEALKVGDSIFAWDGERSLSAQPIRSIERIRSRARVYNLQTDAPHTYFASGIAVHNKGGGGGFGGGGFGGGGGFHGSGGSGDPEMTLIIACIIVGILIIKAVYAHYAGGGSDDGDENLDFSYGHSAVANKADKTRKLLEFIAKNDPAFAPELLESTARSTFVLLQKCWQARDYAPMKPLLMPDLYAEHLSQIQGLIRDHEINMIAELKVGSVDLVNVRYPNDPNAREFTALISASARDYYLDDRTQAFHRGDSVPAPFQEFWTFHLVDGKWLLREIEQTKESDALKTDNFFEPFTDHGVQQVYGDTAGREGPVGPSVEAGQELKATRVERLLNYLVQDDKLWDKQAMSERARKVFLEVCLAREEGDPERIPAEDLFPEIAAHLKEELRSRQAEGASIEFRNLCVRKVDLVLVRNYSDRSKDEFTARITAHAQQVVRRNGQVVSEQPYVTPFEQYWTFGRMDDQWKLKEVEPPATGLAMVGEENVDEGVSRRNSSGIISTRARRDSRRQRVLAAKRRKKRRM